MIESNFRISECTLSIGANNELWRNLKRNKKEIVNYFIRSGIRSIEVGILSNRTYEEDSIYFSSSQLPIKDFVKNEEVLYSLLVQDIDNYNLNYLELYGDKTVDMIRVVLKKNNINRTLRYCQDIQKKGYKICIIIAEVNNYEEDEYQSLLDKCMIYQPYGIYISGEIGFDDKNIINKYTSILHGIMPINMAIGLQLNPEQLQLEYFVEKLGNVRERIFYFDSCMYGINEGYSIAKTEVMVYMLKGSQYDMLPIIRLIDEQFQDIEQIKGTPTYYYLGTALKCSAQYINYYKKSKEVSFEELYEILKKLRIEKGGEFISDKIANEYLVAHRKTELKNKLGIFLITNEFSKAFKTFIEATAHAFVNYGVDLIVVDISISDEIIKYIQEWNAEHNRSKVIYQKIIIDGNDIGNIIKTLLDNCTCDYDYFWAVRNEFVPVISVVSRNLKKWYDKRPELFVLYADDVGIETKEYTDSCVFFEENSAQMSVWATIIFRTDFLKQIVKRERNENLGSFWYSLSCFNYWDSKLINAIRVVDSCFLFNFMNVSSSFWNESKKTIFHWSKEWCDAITSLPQFLNCENKNIYKIELKHFKPFKPRALLIMRGDGTLNYREVKKYKQYILLVSSIPFEIIWAVSFLPKWFARFILKKPKSFISRVTINGFNNLDKHKSKQENEENYFNIISGEKKNDTLINKNEFSPNELCLVIPTSNRPNIIKECLESMLNIYESYKVDVIVLDSSSNDTTKDVIANLRERGYKNVFHEWYTEDYDPMSLDRKAIYGYKLAAKRYKYIWMIRDRILVRFDKIFFEIKNAIDKNADYIIVHRHSFEHPIRYMKEYEDCLELFKEQFCEMTVLGVVIVKSETITKIIDTVPVDVQKNYTLWQPIAFFEYIASHDFLAIVYIQDVFDYHPSAYATGGGSFWLKFYLWQWAERFYTMMTELPAIYGEDRIELMHENIKHFNLYNMWFLIAARGKGGINLREVKKYKRYIVKVSEVPMKIFYLLALTPKFVARCVVKRPYLLNPIRKKWNENKVKYVDLDDYVLAFYE